jgi:hypothetical protein
MIINNTTNIKTIDSIPVWGEARHTNSWIAEGNSDVSRQ